MSNITGVVRNINATSTDASTGLNGVLAPASSTQVGGVNPLGNLQPIAIDTDGRILVDSGQIFGVQNLNVSYIEVSAVSVGSETTINTYTPGVGVTAYLLTILVSGQNVASYQIYKDNVAFDKQYTSFTQYAGTFDYKTGSGSVPGMVLTSANTIKATVINNGTDSTMFNARFLILEVT